MDNRLRVLEQGFNEIQRNVQALRDKAELEQEAKELKKMSLSDENEQPKASFEPEMSKVNTLHLHIKSQDRHPGDILIWNSVFKNHDTGPSTTSSDSHNGKWNGSDEQPKPTRPSTIWTRRLSSERAAWAAPDV